MYDYRKAICEDIRDYIKENYSFQELEKALEADKELDGDYKALDSETGKLYARLTEARLTKQQAEKLIAEMQKKISAVEAKVKKMQPEDRKKGLLFLRFGAIGGKGIIFNDIMTAAGVEDCYEAARHTIADKPGTSRILSKEEVVQANPDYIIIATWSQGGAYKAGNAQLEELYADPALATVTAVKKKQAIVIPQGYVNCLSQHAADSVELLHEAVYGK